MRPFPEFPEWSECARICPFSMFYIRRSLYCPLSAKAAIPRRLGNDGNAATPDMTISDSVVTGITEPATFLRTRRGAKPDWGRLCDAASSADAD